MSIRHRYAAYIELLKRYYTIFHHNWRIRKSRSIGPFNVVEAEFLPSTLSLQERPVSTSARFTAKVLISLIALMLLWSIFGRVDIVVNATGKIIPSDRIKTIESVEVASVRKVFVVEGKLVKAGDVLLELDASTPDAERNKASGDEFESILETLRAQALIIAINSGKPPHLPALQVLQDKGYGITQNEWESEQLHLEGLFDDFVAKKTRIDGDIQHFETSLPLVAQRAEDYRALLQSHDVSRHAWIEKEQARVDLEGQLQEAKNQKFGLIAETKRTAYDQITEGMKAAASSQEDAKRSEAQSKLLKLISPVDGRVEQLTVHTVGGVVAAAQPLMEIVPIAKNIEVEATLQDRDVGFVQEGQTAAVKIDAFEYTKYGTVPAKVAYVSHDAVQDEKKALLYKVKVALSQSSLIVDGKSESFTDGMSVNVDIKTGDRRIIEYMLAPMIQHARESLHER